MTAAVPEPPKAGLTCSAGCGRYAAGTAEMVSEYVAEFLISGLVGVILFPPWVPAFLPALALVLQPWFSDTATD